MTRRAKDDTTISAPGATRNGEDRKPAILTEGPKFKPRKGLDPCWKGALPQRIRHRKLNPDILSRAKHQWHGSCMAQCTQSMTKQGATQNERPSSRRRAMAHALPDRPRRPSQHGLLRTGFGFQGLR